MKARRIYVSLALAALAAGFLASAAFAEDLPDVVERVYPSAAQIHLLSKAKPASKPIAPEVDEFFSRFVPPGSGGSQSRPGFTSAGAGFVVSADGYLVTADFVIEGDSDIRVSFPDGRKFRASPVGRDRFSGVAVLKIDATGLTPLRFGDSSKLRLGERVFAIGSPYNMPGTVTDGIVSALGREHPGLGPTQFIQSSVYINPGSGGGPLFNMKGEVVGMNSHIYSRTGSFTGLSFAVPGEMVQRVYEEIRRTGKVSRGKLGVTLEEPAPSAAGPLDGAQIRQVDAGGAAANAGLRPNDIVVKFNHRPVRSTTELTRLVQDSRPGERVTFLILREGRTETLTAIMGEQ